MTHRVVFLQSAADDLFEIRRYVIKHFSVHLAGRLREDQEGDRESGTLSRRRPCAARAARHSLLEIIAAKNRVIYEVVGDIVYIHIICDCRQDFKTKLARRPCARSGRARLPGRCRDASRASSLTTAPHRACPLQPGAASATSFHRHAVRSATSPRRHLLQPFTNTCARGVRSWRRVSLIGPVPAVRSLALSARAQDDSSGAASPARVRACPASADTAPSGPCPPRSRRSSPTATRRRNLRL